jgi:hypothetical protein
MYGKCTEFKGDTENVYSAVAFYAKDALLMTSGNPRQVLKQVILANLRGDSHYFILCTQSEKNLVIFFILHYFKFA